MSDWVMNLPDWAFTAAEWITADNGLYIGFIIVGVLGLALACWDIWRSR